jgi:hypothetical protein
VDNYNVCVRTSGTTPAPATPTNTQCTTQELTAANQCLQLCAQNDSACARSCLLNNLGQTCLDCIQTASACQQQQGCSPNDPNCCKAQWNQCGIQ